MSETALALRGRFSIYAAISIVAWHVNAHALSELALLDLVRERALFFNPLFEMQVHDGRFHFHTLFEYEARALVRLLECDVPERCREAALRLLRWHAPTLRRHAFDWRARNVDYEDSVAPVHETRPTAVEYSAVRIMVMRYLLRI